jgi:hypothetical protein
MTDRTILQHSTELTSEDAKPRVQPGVHTPFYIIHLGGELRVQPGAWRLEIWAPHTVTLEKLGVSKKIVKFKVNLLL